MTAQLLAQFSHPPQSGERQKSPSLFSLDRSPGLVQYSDHVKRHSLVLQPSRRGGMELLALIRGHLHSPGTTTFSTSKPIGGALGTLSYPLEHCEVWRTTRCGLDWQSSQAGDSNSVYDIRSK